VPGALDGCAAVAFSARTVQLQRLKKIGAIVTLISTLLRDDQPERNEDFAG
jgi:hypothetical protein